MPASQNVFGCAGSKRNIVVRFVMGDEPWPLPSFTYVAPPSVLAQTPCCAMPVKMLSSSGLAATICTLPHSESIPARLPVAFDHAPAGVPAAPPVLGRPPVEAV